MSNRVYALLKAFGAYAIPALLTYAILSATYSWGYYRGFVRGEVTMRTAIMCVLERTADIRPANYCAKEESELRP